jgi:8-oxo-dGTP pyrophosphatase MutT (NUDIX family)
MKRHLTATCYIIKNKKALLVFHKKLQKWLPPGGHIEDGETPGQAARRETREETGIDVELITSEELNIFTPHARSIERPFMCLIEEIPANLKEEAHQHIDLIYVGHPSSHDAAFDPRESEAISWFSENDIEKLSDKEIFAEVRETILHLFEKEPIQ